jgi:Glycoside hydrolase 123, N-terminal domain
VTVAALASLAVLALLSPAGAAPPPRRTGAWDAARYGTQRAVLRVIGQADAVRATIPWRRRDSNPERKELIVVSAASGRRVTDVARLVIEPAVGVIAFRPIDGPGDYDVYYLPHVSTGSRNYPKVSYPEPEEAARPEWLEAHALAPARRAGGGWRRLPEASIVALESASAFDVPTPMEEAATPAETLALVARHTGAAGYLLFPENRGHVIRMSDAVPLRWARRGAGGPVVLSAGRGELVSFQIGVLALRDLAGLAVRFSDLRGPGRTLRGSSVSRFNLAGVDAAGRDFTRDVSVARGTVQALWFGLPVPEDAPAGRYSGRVRLSARGQAATTLPVRLEVTSEVVANAGDDEPQRLSRLRWLDSRLEEEDTVVRPHTPVTSSGVTLGVLGREVELDPAGLPRSIRSHFTPELTGLDPAGRELLAAPVAFEVETADGRRVTASGSGVRFTRRAPGAVAWQSSAQAGPVSLAIGGRLEFDGCLEYQVGVRADAPVELDDVRLRLGVADDGALLTMGLGRKGGRRPDHLEWRWDVAKNQDSIWIGDVSAGVQLSLKDDRYVRPLNTNFYTLKPLVMPASWQNAGKGYCRLAEEDGAFVATCGSGQRKMAAGEVQRYDFRLLLTPFHPLDTRAQLTTRYYHAFKPVEEVKATGANVINVHHATEINPYINYPFLRPAEMKAYVDEAHRAGLRVKIYDTVRELSDHAPELFAFKSLGDEVFVGGPGGGPAWLQEHYGGSYLPGWYVPELDDAALVTSGVSRFHNFYVEGLAWLVKNVGIDGLYIDDVAFDRTTMKRVRRVLERRPGSLIDLHSANQFDPRDGFASSANLYLEHFPYVDRLWFGEYFDYDSPPDYWLVEISGIPFGLMGEMLQNGGNPWRGMLYGMTARLPWAGDPRPLWRFFDEIGIASTRMIGYWSPRAPVKTGRDDVLATTYAGDGRAIVALASWANQAVEVRLAVDWKALGLDPAAARLRAPAIERFQEQASFSPGEPIRVEPGRGFLLVLDASARPDADPRGPSRGILH